MHFFSVHSIGIPLFSRTRVIPAYRPHASEIVLPYQQSHQGLVKRLSLWVVTSGVKNRFRPHCTPPPLFSPPISRERESSRYTHLPGSIPGESLDIIKRMKPEDQAHDFQYLLLLKIRYMHLFSVYNIGIPLFLENKSYPGIPTPRK